MWRIVNETRCEVVDPTAPSLIAARYSGANLDHAVSLANLQEELSGVWWTVCGWEVDFVHTLHLEALARVRGAAYVSLEHFVARHKAFRPLLVFAQRLKRSSWQGCRLALGIVAGGVLLPALLANRLVRWLRAAPPSSQSPSSAVTPADDAESNDPTLSIPAEAIAEEGGPEGPAQYQVLNTPR